MTSSTHRVLAVTAITAVAAGLGLAGCGGTSHGQDGSGPTTTTVGPPPVVHAKPVTLLPTPEQVAGLIRPAGTASRYGETVSPSTFSSAFASRVPRALALSSGTAELDVIGHRGTFLYVHVFLFKSPAGAEALTPAFLTSTRLRTRSSQPAGAPGQAGAASSQRYGKGQVSYRYAFRQDNVLAYVELDGPRTKYSLAQAAHVAALVYRRVQDAAVH